MNNLPNSIIEQSPHPSDHTGVTMLSHWKQDKTRHRHIPKFHRNSLWQHADLDDHDRNHATSSCSREPEQPLFQAMPFRRRDSSPDHDATPLRRVHPPDSLEASRLDFILTFRRQYLTDAPIGQDVQFRKLILPGSDSYDGTTELSSRELATHQTPPGHASSFFLEASLANGKTDQNNSQGHQPTSPFNLGAAIPACGSPPPAGTSPSCWNSLIPFASP